MDTMQLAKAIARELGLDAGQVARTIALFDEGNTIPFVARYRKEMTGGLDEEQLRTISERLDYGRKLDERKQTVIKQIEEQGRLNPDLKAKIEAAPSLQEVEDLYLPYKPKRRTRAMIARERGLEPLAEMILAQQVSAGTPELYAANYLSDHVPTVEEALAGARDIVAERVSENAEARAWLRQFALSRAQVTSRLAKGAEDSAGKYHDYYEYNDSLATIPHHRLLAVNRGERDQVLTVAVTVDDQAALRELERRYVRRRESVFYGQLMLAIEDGYRRLLFPSIVREVRAARTAEAEAHAIRVFAANLRSLLLQPPIARVRVLGLDPGFRTGCKAAICDETGKYLASFTIYPHEPQKRWDEAKRMLREAVAKLGVQVVAIGNGTASRETEALVAELIQEGVAVSYVMVSEAGASVYSASKLAGQELPQIDVSIRGAVSIARRLQDPLAELVKIEPRSIGVGLYQHDVDQKQLAQALDGVVESAVNYVGVEANTASAALLQYVSGLNARVAASIVAHREANGPFRRRQDLLAVKGLGAKAFEQSAGFIKIRDGDDPLDNTFIHPESYAICHRLLAAMDLNAGERDLSQHVRRGWANLVAQGETEEKLARRLGAGIPTLKDMLANLLKPGRDPREDLPAPILRTDVLKMEDLRPGMMLKGTVRNAVDFGAFVDIGVKQDGLVHVSELAERFVRDPLEVVSVGDVVEVRVLGVDAARGRISLSMKK